MKFVEFVEKYQQDMTPEQMFSIAKTIGKYLSCKLSDAEELKEMVVLMAIDYPQILTVCTQPARYGTTLTDKIMNWKA